MDGCEEQDVLVHKMMLSNQWIPAPSWAQARPPPPRSSRPQSHPQHERAARTQRTDKSFDLPKANLVLQMMTRAHLSTLADVRHLFFNDRSLTTGGADTNDHIEALRLMLRAVQGQAAHQGAQRADSHYGDSDMVPASSSLGA